MMTFEEYCYLLKDDLDTWVRTEITTNAKDYAQIFKGYLSITSNVKDGELVKACSYWHGAMFIMVEEYDIPIKKRRKTVIKKRYYIHYKVKGTDTMFTHCALTKKDYNEYIKMLKEHGAEIIEQDKLF